MKSIIQEASSIAKAIEQAWIKAGKPREFSVKVLEEAEKNFFGFTKKMAKISLFFNGTSGSDTHHKPRHRYHHRRSHRHGGNQQERTGHHQKDQSFAGHGKPRRSMHDHTSSTDSSKHTTNVPSSTISNDPTNE